MSDLYFLNPFRLSDERRKFERLVSSGVAEGIFSFVGFHGDDEVVAELLLRSGRGGWDLRAFGDRRVLGRERVEFDVAGDRIEFSGPDTKAFVSDWPGGRFIFQDRVFAFSLERACREPDFWILAFRTRRIGGIVLVFPRVPFYFSLDRRILCLDGLKIGFDWD